MSDFDLILEKLGRSHSVFHAVEEMKTTLLASGFMELDEKKPFELSKGKGYFLIRNDTSIIAFYLPNKEADGFRIAASHNDSPCFKLKAHPIMDGPYGVRLNVEPYGGMIMSTWLDRPLSFAGRVFYEEKGKTLCKLIDFGKDAFVIPNLAIHMNREANDGYKFNPAIDTIPLLGGSLGDKTFEDLLKEKTDIKGEILAHDLFTYTCEEPKLVGLNKEYLLSPRLDDLSAAYSSLMAFVNCDKGGNKIPVFASFDNEEIGSLTMQGAFGDFLKVTLGRILEALGLSDNEKGAFYANSISLSVDNAHANHPNHLGKSDPTTSVKLNGGIVIKYNASAHYTTDGRSAAYVKQLCNELKEPFQEFANRSDMRGGSTLGNLSNNQISMVTADIGIAQLAMHSSVELCGAEDIERMVHLLKAHFENK